MPFMVTKDDLSRKGFNYAVVHPQKEIMLPPILSKEDKNLIKERLLKLNIDAQLGELLKKIETIVVISSEKEVEAIVSSLNKRTLPYKPISQEDKDKLMGELSTVREEFFPYAEQVLSYTPYLIQELDIFSSTELPLEESKERVSLDLEGVNILIKVKDKIVGFITSTRENNDYSEDVDILKKYILEEDKVLYVDDIYIHPLLRNNHFVLLKLVRAFYNEAKAKGFLQIISHVRKSNGLSDFLKNRGAVFITTNKEWLKGEFLIFWSIC